MHQHRFICLTISNSYEWPEIQTSIGPTPTSQPIGLRERKFGVDQLPIIIIVYTNNISRKSLMSCPNTRWCIPMALCENTRCDSPNLRISSWMCLKIRSEFYLFIFQWLMCWKMFIVLCLVLLVDIIFTIPNIKLSQCHLCMLLCNSVHFENCFGLTKAM